jgi:hypothetical protein
MLSTCLSNHRRNDLSFASHVDQEKAGAASRFRCVVPPNYDIMLSAMAGGELLLCGAVTAAPVHGKPSSHMSRVSALTLFLLIFVAEASNTTLRKEKQAIMLLIPSQNSGQAVAASHDQLQAAGKLAATTSFYHVSYLESKLASHFSF